ncbi:MAG: AzlC family ABC transporter permease [Acholeplasmatales bacterium]|nr:AzlC family ABC transporter permease [Acholeplasmatales bacterium]
MNDFVYGMKKGIPIALGYFAVSFSFGVMAVTGITPLMATIISATNLTSSGQYAGVRLMMQNASYIELLLTVLLINLRYSLMSISLSQKIENMPIGVKLLIGFGITDEIYAVSITDSHKINAKYMFGLILLPFIGWVGGTAAGAFGSQFFNKDLLSAMGIALYAMFIAIIIPDARKSKPIFLVILIASAISCAFYYIPGIKEIGLGFKIIIATIVASIIGAIFFPIQDDLEDPEVEFKAKSGDLDV